MNEKQLHEFKVGGLNVHVLPSKTYKTNTFLLHMREPLTAESITNRALLPFVLQSGTKEYPSRQGIRQALDDLYGATLNVDVSKKGEHHLMSFKMEVANEKFLEDNRPLLERGMKLFSSVILSPKESEGSFDEAIIEGEKRTLKQKISSVYDDKMRYANMRLTEEMCEGEPFGIFVYGDEDSISNVSNSSLYQYYKKALQDNQMDLYIVGDVDINDMKTLVEKYFQGIEADDRDGDYLEIQKKKIDNPKEIIEEQDVQQGKLHIGYRTNTTYQDNDYFALQLFNGIFGGFSHSKLFINVREKASLAYYAASRVESHKGLLIVMSGIESDKYEKATTIIREQMDQMKQGNFTEDDIEQTKAVLKNQLLETMDVPRGYIELEYHNELSPTKRKVTEWITEIDKVSKEEIVQVAQKIELDTVYFLKGKGDSSDE